jgi:hypothetical protein
MSNMMNKILTHIGVRSIFIPFAVFWFIGILSLPIAYFTFLRITTAFGSLLAINILYKRENWIFLSVFVLLALLFNPIAPIYLQKKSIWIPLDVMAGAAFLCIAFFGPKSEKTEDKPIDIHTPPKRNTLVRDRIVSNQKTE